MQTVDSLKKRGFGFSAVPDALCTKVTFPGLFHYFNPKFLDDAADIVTKLSTATDLGNGEFQLLVAGNFGDADLFPFVIVTPNEADAILKAHADLEEARTKRDEAIADVARAGKALWASIESCQQGSNAT